MLLFGFQFTQVVILKNQLSLDLALSGVKGLRVDFRLRNTP